MNEEKFFGKSEGINPENTLKEAADQMEEIDEENQNRGGNGTVAFKNLADKKMRINLSTEKVPEPKDKKQENN